MDKIQTDTETQFTSKDFQEGLSVQGVQLKLAAPEHQEINDQVKVTWWKFQIITQSIMVHTQVSDEYIHFELMNTTHHIFTVLPIKHLITQDGEPTTPHTLATGTKPSVSNLRVLFCPCVVKDLTAKIDRKALNTRHQ